uniref:Uncharacterized protein n=1 Tax=Opuntia streptacantha TaxID=393608 RepID=A0A7C9AMZ2_OPUST
MPVGFYPYFSHISLRFPAAVAVGLDLGVWVATIPVLDCNPTSSYCSSTWRASVGQNTSGLCAADTVRDVVTSQSLNRQSLDYVRYGMVALSCSPPSNKVQVWVLPPLPYWVYLTPLILAVFRWWCGCLIHYWRRLIVVSLLTSVTLMGRPHCGDDEYCVCPLLLCHSGLAIYNPSQRLRFVIGFWWPLLDVDLLSMSSPSPYASQALGHSVVLPSSATNGREGARTGAKMPHILNITEGASSKSPSPLTAVTFSEALILGVGCQDQPSAKASESLGRESASLPTQPASMSSLCLLGKPWGDPIPLSIVMSKTCKDWGFIKGQLD